MLLRTFGSFLSPGGPGGRLAILIYHRVLESPDPLFPEEVDAARFDWQMRVLAQEFSVLPLREAIQRLRQGTLPRRAAAVTFDDGYADNFRVALPILRRHGVPATFFVASAYLDGGIMWNDIVIEALRRAPGPSIDLDCVGMGVCRLETSAQRRQAVDRAIPRLKYLPAAERLARAEAVRRAAGLESLPQLMMRPAEVAGLERAGMEVGCHTRTHPILARLSRSEAMDEIAGGRSDLERILGRRPALFAYPNGKPREDYAPEHVAMIRELGFEAAVSTHWGCASGSSDLFQLPRFTPWDRTPARFAMRLMLNYRRGSAPTDGAMAGC